MLTRRRFLQIAAASSGLAITANELLSQAVANASTALRPDGSRGIRHIVILMMENRSFDHFLGWLPGADGRHDLTFVSSVDGNTYPNYPLAPDYQGCGYSDPDHSWEGFLVEHNYGKLDGFLQRPTTPAGIPGVKLAAANTFPIGYYTNLNHDGTRKALPDLPVIGALAEQYTTLDRYFCAFAGETYPNRFYQHAGQTDRDHNSFVPSTLPTIWDQLSPIPNSQGIPTGGYCRPGPTARRRRTSRRARRAACRSALRPAVPARACPATAAGAAAPAGPCPPARPGRVPASR
jgi:phospholipase C